jgi:hypothetical protein
MAHLLWFAKFFAISPAQGAETIVYLASSPDVATTTGQYYYKCVPTTLSRLARDDRSALLLWRARRGIGRHERKWCVKRIPQPVARYH